MYKILMLSGSLSLHSHTFKLLEEISKELVNEGCEITLWDLNERKLPMADPIYHSHPSDHPEPVVKELVRLASEAHAFVWGSPLYHNSYSGVLKNALDLLNYDQFKNKPIGLVTNGGGIRNVQALDHMRIVARGLLGVAIPMQIATCISDFTRKDDTLEIGNEEIILRVRAFTQQLLYFCQKLQN